ncbi:hypothetical protein CPC08DRAFT_711151 [Agrocybe pediades]|nr:hypothetical protein CPC08DRAFT_711151 [Agrocybe pediades]
MPPSKGHKKSRNGCIICKQRRIKCDETHPVCKNCTAYGEPLPCSYNPPKPTKSVHPAGAGSSRPERSSSAATVEEVTGQDSIAVLATMQQNRPPNASFGRLCSVCGHFHLNGMGFSPNSQYPGGLPGCKLINLTTCELNWNASSSILQGLKDLPHPSLPAFLNSYESLALPKTIASSEIDLFTDMALLNHYTTSTSFTLSLSYHPDSRHLWSQVIPTLSQANSFLFHAILAITAAHIGYTTLKGEDTEKAGRIRLVEERHYIEAMRLLKAEITQGIDEINCHANFTATVMCMFYFVSRRRRPSPFNPLSGKVRRHLDLSWTTFIRGSCGALHGLWPLVKRGPVALLIHEFPLLEPSSQMLSPNTEMMLARLNTLCMDFNLLGPAAAKEMADMGTASAYYAALYQLRMIWVALESCCSSAGASRHSDFDSDGNEHLPEPQDRHFRKELGIGESALLSSCILQYSLRTLPAFWECLENKSPRALIIYAYYVICWQGLSYGSCNPAVREVLSEGGGTPGRTEAWWVEGRAETDLKGVEEELSEIATNDSEREAWREWLGGAWNVLEGLKNGWWLENNVASIPQPGYSRLPHLLSSQGKA